MQKHQGTNPAAFLSNLDRTIQSTERELDKLQKYVTGLRLARENVAAMVLSDAAQPRTTGQNSRAEVIREILESRTDPVDMDLIMKELQRRNMDAPRPHVAASLSYLKRTGAAWNSDRGKWQAAQTRQVA